MRIALCIALVAAAAMLAACSGKQHTRNANIPTEELRQLNEVIADAPKYRNAVRQYIDSVDQLADKNPDPAKAAEIYNNLTHKISVMEADSAIDYANKAIATARRSGNDSILTSARISRLSALTSAGIFNLAEEELFVLELEPMSPLQRIFFWQVARQLYAYLQLYTIENYEISSEFGKKTRAYDDSLMRNLPNESHFKQFLECERMTVNGNFRRAQTALNSLLKEIDPSDNLYGMAAFQLAITYKHTGNERMYGAYMARAAMSDIKAGVREGLALFSLANWMYDQGEISAAFEYINFAMREAMTGNVRMRAVNIASMLPMIDETYLQANNNSHDRLMLYITISVLLLTILAAILLLLAIERRKKAATQAKLIALSKTQETHTANFLALCSTYYHKLNSLEMLVRRKIASGQTEELLRLLKSGRYSEDQGDEISDIFDRSILDIYPDFIEQINALLRPEERFPNTGEKTLHNELRIYALVKMGITENARIAQILNYSVNTVYAYRNKMRNKAIDRENFEANVAELSGVNQ